MKVIAALIFSCLFFLSCQKEINFDTPVAANKTCKTCSYVPFCNGSVYIYSDTVLGTGTEVTNTINITGDSTINGKVFQKYTFSGGSGFYNCTSGTSTSINQGSSPVTGTLLSIEQTLLKANEQVGATWVNVISVGTGQTMDFNFKLVAKGLSKTLFGVTYTDVMQVHLSTDMIIPIVGSVVINEADFYYANNIGLIEAITYTSVPVGPPVVTLHRVLKSYSIP